MKNEIVYLTSSLFPSGQAYSTRVVGLSAIFKELGCQVHVIADHSLDKTLKQNEAYEFQYGTYEIVGKSGRLSNLFFNAWRSINALKRRLDQGNVKAVVTNAASDRFLQVLSLCRNKKLPLILEVCEWYDRVSTHFKIKMLDYRNVRLTHMMKKDYFKADGIIAISRFLENHFLAGNNNVVRIPTVFDIKDFRYDQEKTTDKCILVHAGCSVTRKEKFASIMEAVAQNGCGNFEYRIYGSNMPTVIQNVDGNTKLVESLGNSLKVFGSIPYQEVNQAYRASDFSIFMRPNTWANHAGFPTKLAESMAAGTPVITNNTGDIGLYLKDGVNGFLLDDFESSTIAEVLKKCLSMTRGEFKTMRQNARKTAEEMFDYHIYAEMLNKLIELAENKAK